MRTEKENIIGIVGGMGPEAGVNLVNAIVNFTDATIDQDHLSVILMSFPGHIVDRTAYLEGKTAVNPAHSIANIIGKLEAAGAKIIGIACNTTHSPLIFNVIVEELKKKEIKIQLLHMPLEACNFIKSNYNNIKRIGLMATNGTYRAGVYKKILLEMGYEVVIPNPDFQENIIHKMIYDPVFGIKAKPGVITKEVAQLYQQALNFFTANRADAIILGCTELSLLKEIQLNDMLLVDATQTFALALYNRAKPGVPSRYATITEET